MLDGIEGVSSTHTEFQTYLEVLRLELIKSSSLGDREKTERQILAAIESFPSRVDAALGEISSYYDSELNTYANKTSQRRELSAQVEALSVSLNAVASKLSLAVVESMEDVLLQILISYEAISALDFSRVDEFLGIKHSRVFVLHNGYA